MRKAMIFTAAFAMTAVSATTVSAKSSLHLSTNKVSTSSKYITGKATPHSKIAMTRYGMVYAKGTSTKHGTFKIRLRSVLSSGCKYRMTASKKGYSVKKCYVSVPKKREVTGVDTTPYLAENNPNATQNATNTVGQNSTNQAPAATAPIPTTASSTSQNGFTTAQKEALQSQLSNLQDQRNYLANQVNICTGKINAAIAAGSQDTSDALIMTDSREDLQDRVDWLSKDIDRDIANHDTTAEQADTIRLNEAKERLAAYDQLVAKGITTNSLTVDEEKQRETLAQETKKRDDFTSQIDQLSEKESEIDKQLNPSNSPITSY